MRSDLEIKIENLGKQLKTLTKPAFFLSFTETHSVALVGLLLLL